MFCKKCQNFMDITNNVVIHSQTQSGGKPDNIDSNENIVESSDFDVSSEVEVVATKKKNGHIVVLDESDLIDILNGNFTKELDNYNIKDVTKIPYYNKLSDNQKSLLTTRIFDKLSKNQKNQKNMDNGIVKDSYFYCKSCGYYEKIPDKTFIFSRSFDKNNNDLVTNNFLNYKYDNTLPYSKKYNCENKACQTHKDPSIKKAVFYRLNNTYNIRYICTICDHYWSTVNES